MLKITINPNNVVNPSIEDLKVIELPTKIEEIQKNLLEITKNVHLAENQSLIALCCKETIPSIVLAGRQKKNLTTAVIPLFIKTGESKSDFINSIESGDVIVISGSQLAVGHHVVIKNNEWDMDRVFITCTKDKNIIQKSTEYKDTPVYFVEYKIVNNFDIVGSYKN